MKTEFFKKKWFLGGLSALIISFVILLDGTPFLISDSYAYYHSAKSFVETGKVYTDDKPEYYRYSPYVSQFNGKYLSIVNPGEAFLTVPGLEISKFVNSGTIYNNYYKAFNGHSFADGFAILITDVVLAVSSVLFIYFSLKEFGYSKRVALLATAAAVASTYVYSYTVELIGFTHIPELFGISGALYFALKSTKLFSTWKKSTKSIFIYSALFGLMASIAIAARPTNVLIILPFGLYIIFAFFKKGNFKKQIATEKKKIAQTVLAIIAGAAPFALMFFAYNLTLYGGIFSTGYTVVTGSDTIFSLSQWHIFEILFSPIRGWFVYSPIALFAMISIVKRQFNKKVVLLTFVPILLTVLLYSIFPFWWAGHSIGQRFFIVLTPFVAIGAAEFIVWSRSFAPTLRKIAIGLIILCAIYSVSITLLSRFTPLQDLYRRYGTASSYIGTIPQEEAFTPVDIYRYHFETISSSTGIKDYISKLQTGFQGARSIALLALGQTDPIVKVEPVSKDTIKLHIIPSTRSKVFTADITATVLINSKYSQLNFSNINFAKYSEITIVCNEYACASKDATKVTETSQLPNLNKASFVLYDNYSVAVGYSDSNYSGEKVKFVDEKLYK